jgi:hypothetical protein
MAVSDGAIDGDAIHHVMVPAVYMASGAAALEFPRHALGGVHDTGACRLCTGDRRSGAQIETDEIVAEWIGNALDLAWR